MSFYFKCFWFFYFLHLIDVIIYIFLSFNSYKFDIKQSQIQIIEYVFSGLQDKNN